MECDYFYPLSYFPQGGKVESSPAHMEEVPIAIGREGVIRGK